MSKGYLVLAQNNKECDYVKLAYALALSIKLTQSEVNNITLITDNVYAIPNHYKSVFDQILPIQWNDDAVDSEWKIENRWKLYHFSPYDETIVLDADMLFLSDVSQWWNYLGNNFDLLITDNVYTYRNELITNSYYREALTKNKLSNCYSAFTYFKKTESAQQFWELVEIIVKDWKTFYNSFLKESKPKHLSIDVVFALAVKILAIDDKVFSSLDYPTFTHMKSYDQKWKSCGKKWMHDVGVYFNDQCKLKIGNYQQTGIFHYTEKDFMTDDKILKYEKMLKIWDQK